MKTAFAKIGSAILASLTIIGISAQAADKIEVKLDSSTEVVVAKDINGIPAKSKLTSTATYEEYALAPVVDGIKKRKDLGWQECSWASAEDDTVHAIQIELSKPQRGGRFQITWAYDIHNEDSGKFWVSRDYVIQVKDKAGDPWNTVIVVKGNQSIVACHALPDTAIGFIRIYQPVGGGHPDRPNIMWVGQVELLD